jgi:hypothetical protein
MRRASRAALRALLALLPALLAGGALGCRRGERPAEGTGSPEATPPAAAASSAASPAADPGLAAARATLRKVIEGDAADPKNAWALAHGILAMGRGFKASDGRLASRVIVDDFAQTQRLPGLRGLHPYFPKTRDGARVEPHTDLILKTFVDAGIGLDEPLTDGQGALTARILLDSAQKRFQATRGEQTGDLRFADVDDVAWSVQAFCQAATPANAGPSSWQPAGVPPPPLLQLEDVSAALLSLAEKETWFIRQAMASGQTVEKKRQDVFAHTCGGAHLFQAVAQCAAAGWPKKGNTNARLQALVDIYLWRIPFETQLVETTLAENPQFAPLLVNQDVKFLGHALESLGRAARGGLWRAGEEQRRLLDLAAAKLVERIGQAAKLGVYGRPYLDKLAGSPESYQFYLDVVGDACHAWKGLELWEQELRRED